jgi:hypothetical protein
MFQIQIKMTRLYRGVNSLHQTITADTVTAKKKDKPRPLSPSSACPRPGTNNDRTVARVIERNGAVLFDTVMAYFLAYLR